MKKKQVREQVQTKQELYIKVTKIMNKWHARLYYRDKIYDEMACTDRLDIGLICRIMMRWLDKSGGNRYSSSSRARHNNDRAPVGKIFYLHQIQKSKEKLFLKQNIRYTKGTK